MNAAASIIEYPDARLRAQSSPIIEFGSDLAELLERLEDTQAVAGGIGLCAPQIGVAKRVILVNVEGDAFGSSTYINPEIVSRAGLGVVQESCLSLPGIFGKVLRAAAVRVRAQDAHGKVFERDVVGLHAVCVQHEIDHLDGKLFTDRLFWFQKFRINKLKRQLQENARETAPAGLPT
ncbi:MAG: peptide deformylase [Pseudomonadota bacterium]